MTSAWEAGCAAQGPGRALAAQRGGRGTGVFLGCAADRRGSRPGATHPSLSCLLSFAVMSTTCSQHPGRKPCSDPDLVTDLLSLGPCLLSAKTVSFSAKWLFETQSKGPGEAGQEEASPASWPFLLPCHPPPPDTALAPGHFPRAHLRCVPLKFLTSPLPHSLFWGLGREMPAVSNHAGNLLKAADWEQRCMYQGGTRAN